jgi:hypothetical protein
MTPLCLLAKQYGTDKLRHGYTPLYNELFHPIRSAAVNVVELGVLNGASSIRMWADYFTEGTVYAVDVNEPRLRRLPVDPRIIPVVADAGRKEQLAALPARIDIVIDDASHKPDDQIAAFDCLWPRIVSGGYYSIEDMHAGWAFQDGRHKFIDYICRLVTECARNTGPLHPFADVRFFRNLVIVAKH